MLVSWNDQVVIFGLLQFQLERVHGVVTGISQQVGQPRRSVLIDQESHEVGWRGISRSATASAANRNAVATSSSSNGGSSSTISSGVIPFAIIPTTVATGIRNPRMQGSPPICLGLMVIRSTPTAYPSSAANTADVAGAHFERSELGNLFPGPLSTDEAFDRVDAWLAQPSAILVHPTQRHAGIVRELLRSVGTGGNLVNDAHLAALAIQHRGSVVSYDADFDRFEDVSRERPSP